MKTNSLETITKAPLTAEIYQDENYNDSPDDWGNTDLFLVGFHRDFTVNRDGFSKEVCQGLAGDEYEAEEHADRVKEIRKQYHTIGLEAYIHSGIVLALSNEGSFVDRQWDVSQLGLVFIEKKQWRTRAAARKAALGLIETWNQNLSGDVYGYNIPDTNDSCWGFYGMDSVREAAHEALDYAWKELQKKNEAKKRAEIVNRVPLEKRTHSTI